MRQDEPVQQAAPAANGAGTSDADRHILGHKLSNLLSPVVGMAYILSTKAAASGDAEVQRIADTIHDAAKAATSLLSMFVQVRDIEASVYVPCMRAADLDLLLESIVGEMTGDPAYSGARVDLAIVRPCRMMMDCDLLPRAFSYIIGGAVYHVTQEPDRLQRLVTVALECEHGQVRVTIRYGSAPLDPGRVERFFHPFGGTAGSGDGRTGLEYSYARAAIEAHGGRVSVASPISGGVTVTVVLPGGDCLQDAGRTSPLGCARER